MHKHSMAAAHANQNFASESHFLNAPLYLPFLWGLCAVASFKQRRQRCGCVSVHSHVFLLAPPIERATRVSSAPSSPALFSEDARIADSRALFFPFSAIKHFAASAVCGTALLHFFPVIFHCCVAPLLMNGLYCSSILAMAFWRQGWIHCSTAGKKNTTKNHLTSSCVTVSTQSGAPLVTPHPRYLFPIQSASQRCLFRQFYWKVDSWRSVLGITLAMREWKAMERLEERSSHRISQLLSSLALPHYQRVCVNHLTRI